MKSESIKCKGVIFDMDGTIIDVPYDWDKIRADIETQGKPILAFIQGLGKSERLEKWKILEKYEREATQKAVLKEGIPELFEFLAKKGIKTALVTNNSAKNVDYLLEKFDLTFDCVITRESGLWKPSGEPLLAALETMEVKKEECCLVGDSHFDIKAAGDAGIDTVFILNSEGKKFSSDAIEVLNSVWELFDKIESLL